MANNTPEQEPEQENTVLPGQITIDGMSYVDQDGNRHFDQSWVDMGDQVLARSEDGTMQPITKRDYISDKVGAEFSDALDKLEEIEKETAQKFRARNDAILKLFENAPPDLLHDILSNLDEHTAGAWYKNANAGFQSGKYDVALGAFIPPETTRLLSAMITSEREKFAVSGKKMTLADFLSRTHERPESYFDQILKAASATNTELAVTQESIFDRMEIPMYSSDIVLGVSAIQSNKKKWIVNEDNKTARITTPYGATFTVDKFPSLEKFGLKEKKFILTSVAALANNNAHQAKGSSICLYAKFPLITYGEYCRTPAARSGNPKFYTPREMTTLADQEKENKLVRGRLRKLRMEINQTQKNAQELKFLATVTKGEYANQVMRVPYFSGEFWITTENGVETVTVGFTQTAAESLISQKYMTMFPWRLLSIDERDENTFALGVEIMYHSNYDSNVNRGTANTHIVRTLIGYMPNLPTYKEMQSKGYRNWRAKIKTPLENSLDKLKEIDHIQRWEYRNPKTNKRMSKSVVDRLDYLSWENLRIDYIYNYIDPDQDDRRERRSEEKQAAIAKREAKSAKNKHSGKQAKT